MNAASGSIATIERGLDPTEFRCTMPGYEPGIGVFAQPSSQNTAAPGWGAAGGRVVDAVSARETKTAREVNMLVGQFATHTNATKASVEPR